MSTRPIDNRNAWRMAERASEELYRMRAISWAALVVAHTTDLFGEDEFFRRDALIFQLEAIHASAKQNEAMFDQAASDAMQREKAAMPEKQQQRRSKGVVKRA